MPILEPAHDRAHPIESDTHFGGIIIGTDGGDLHRGWVWREYLHQLDGYA